MMEVKITVILKCPDLVDAAKILTGAKKNVEAQPEPVSAQVQQPVSALVPAVTTAVTTTAAPAAAAPVPTVPVSSAPAYTVDQIGKAGAELLAQTNGAAMPQLTALLQKYGVTSADKLKPDQLGTFATELRGLGAKL